MGSKNEKLHSRVVKLEAENAKLKEDLGSWDALLGDGVSSQVEQDKLKKELAKLKEENNKFMIMWQESTYNYYAVAEELAKLKEESEKWNRTFEEACDEKLRKELDEMQTDVFSLKKDNEFLEAENASLKKQVSGAHEFCKVALKDRDKDTQVIMDLQEELAK